MNNAGLDNGQFKKPHGIAIDPEDNVNIMECMTDMDNFRVQKFDSKGNFLTKWGSEGSEDGQFKKPEDIAVDSVYNRYRKLPHPSFGIYNHKLPFQSVRP